MENFNRCFLSDTRFRQPIPNEVSKGEESNESGLHIDCILREWVFLYFIDEQADCNYHVYCEEDSPIEIYTQERNRHEGVNAHIFTELVCQLLLRFCLNLALHLNLKLFIYLLSKQ